MHYRTRSCVVLACALSVVLADSAGAFPRRWRQSNVSYGSGGIKAVAPKVDAAASGYRNLRAAYSYDRAMEEDVAFTDRVRVFLSVSDEQVLNAADEIVAEVKITNLANQSAPRIQYCPVTFQPTVTGHSLGVFEVVNLPGGVPIIEPAKVYRFFVTLHRRSEEYGRNSVIGKVSMPYYVATAGDERLDRARQHIAMRTFKEFYYAQNGWASSERYPMDCYAYYMWATGSCTVGAQNGRTVLGRLFGGRRPFQGGGDIVGLARQGALHGDYVRIPGHSFMILAYDPQAGHVWTMEGNFNSTIEIAIRSIDSGWTVGHLVEEHVQPSLFQVSRARTPDSEEQPRL